MSAWPKALVVFFIFSLVAHRLVAQNGLVTPTLRHLSQKSGSIFSGTVLATAHSSDGSGSGLPMQQVTIRVDQAIRGVIAGQTITFRQLAGLSDATNRYRTGERLLLFLYPKSKLGLTTPVEGAFGRFEIDGDGRVLLEQARVSALSSDPILKVPLRNVPRLSGAAVSNTLFRRAVTRAMENRQ
jgi:hypothetical protein